MKMNWKKIMFTGDSVTDCRRARPIGDGFGTIGESYLSRIFIDTWADIPNHSIRYMNSATSGNTSKMLLDRFDEEVLSYNPDYVFIMIGINDIWHEFDFCNGVECDRYEFIYRELLKWSRNKFPCIQFILIDPFILSNSNLPKGMATEVASRRIVVKKLAREFHALHLDTQELFDAACSTAPTNHWSYDGVHPTIAGHRLLANAWLELFKKITVV